MAIDKLYMLGQLYTKSYDRMQEHLAAGDILGGCFRYRRLGKQEKLQYGDVISLTLFYRQRCFMIQYVIRSRRFLEIQICKILVYNKRRKTNCLRNLFFSQNTTSVQPKTIARSKKDLGDWKYFSIALQLRSVKTFEFPRVFQYYLISWFCLLGRSDIGLLMCRPSLDIFSC